MKKNTKEFVREAFDYRNQLQEVSVERSVNRYLLEYIANGFVKYKSVSNFIKNIDAWIRSVVKIFPELGFDHKTNQIKAVIDLQDQLVIVDESLYDDLSYIINIQENYGLLIEYKIPDKGVDVTSTTLCHFFEYIEGLYPVIKDRFKGLGSTEAEVSKEVLMDPATRRIIKVNMEDINTIRQLGYLIGESKNKENITARKEMLANFKFDKTMIDN